MNRTQQYLAVINTNQMKHTKMHLKSKKTIKHISPLLMAQKQTQNKNENNKNNNDLIGLAPPPLDLASSTKPTNKKHQKHDRIRKQKSHCQKLIIIKTEKAVLFDQITRNDRIFQNIVKFLHFFELTQGSYALINRHFHRILSLEKNPQMYYNSLTNSMNTNRLNIQTNPFYRIDIDQSYYPLFLRNFFDLELEKCKEDSDYLQLIDESGLYPSNTSDFIEFEADDGDDSDCDINGLDIHNSVQMFKIIKHSIVQSDFAKLSQLLLFHYLIGTPFVFAMVLEWVVFHFLRKSEENIGFLEKILAHLYDECYSFHTHFCQRIYIENHAYRNDKVLGVNRRILILQMIQKCIAKLIGSREREREMKYNIL